MSICYDEIEYLKDKNITYIKEYIYNLINDMTCKDDLSKECFSILQKYPITKSNTFLEEIIVGLIWDDIANQMSPFIRNENFKKIETLCKEMNLNFKNVEIIGSHPGIIEKIIYKHLEKDR